MVNAILSCESFAGRSSGEKCMDLRFLRLRRRLLKQQPDKTVFYRFIKNLYQIIVAPNADLNNRYFCLSERSALKSSFR